MEIKVKKVLDFFSHNMHHGTGKGDFSYNSQELAGHTSIHAKISCITASINYSHPELSFCSPVC